MEKDLDYTMKFEGINEEKLSVSETIDFVPINQIIGYLLSGDSSYITSYKNARSVIKQFERDEILEEVLMYYLNRK